MAEMTGLTKGVSLVKILESRAHVYDVYSRLWAGVPDAAAVEDLTSGETMECTRTVYDCMEDDTRGDLYRCYEILVSIREEREQVGAEAYLEAAQASYRRFFTGENRLYSLFHRDYEKRTFSRATLAEACREQGYVPPEGFPQETDHLAVELGFLAKLSRQTLNAVRNREGDFPGLWRKQKRFLNEFLFRWIFLFSNSVRDAALTLYEPLAAAQPCFFRADMSLLSHGPVA